MSPLSAITARPQILPTSVTTNTLLYSRILVLFLHPLPVILGPDLSLGLRSSTKRTPLTASAGGTAYAYWPGDHVRDGHHLLVPPAVQWSCSQSPGGSPGIAFFIRFCFSACYFVARGVCKALNQLLCPLGFRGTELRAQTVWNFHQVEEEFRPAAQGSSERTRPLA